MKKFSTTFVTINGKRKSTISVFDHGFLYGDGVFDSFRIFRGIPFHMREHIDRLYQSAQTLNLKIPFGKIQLTKKILNVYKQSNLRDAFVRTLVTRGKAPQGMLIKAKPNTIIICSVRAFKPLQKTKAIIAKIKKFSYDGAGRSVKSLNFGATVEALQQAKKQNKDEVIFFNEKGWLVEASTSNIFLVKNSRLFTPPLKSGILPGITRKLVMQNFPVKEKNLSVKDLFSAEEVFLTGTVNFVTSVKSIDEKQYKIFQYAKTVFAKLYPFKN